MPAGFQDVSSSVTVDASIGKEKYRSAVALGDRDLIIISVYELSRTPTTSPTTRWRAS